jgi:copper transport protein
VSDGHDDGRHAGGRRRLQGLVLLCTVLGLLLLGGGPASAHAALRSTDPADGSVVKSAPRSITLTFTESIALLDDSFRVLDPDNKRVEVGKAGHADGRADTARITLPKKLGTGTFTVAWRVVSADSHPVAGAFTFSVGKASPTMAALPDTATDNPATDGLYNIGRYLAYLAAALLIGAAAFVAVCRPPDARPLRRPLLVGGWTLAGSTLFLLLLRAPYESGSGPADALDPSGLSRTLDSRPGLALVARLVLLAAAAVLLLRQRGRGEPSRAVLVTGAVLAVGLALTWAAAEHASAGIQVPAAMTSSVLHLLAMAVWLGGLTALLLLLPRASVPARVVNRFSQVAGVSVTVLVVTGVYQSWRGLGSVSALTDTTYGRVLLAKLGAVLLLLAAGAWSRRTVRGVGRASAKTAERKETGVPEPTDARTREESGTAETADPPLRTSTTKTTSALRHHSSTTATSTAVALADPASPDPETHDTTDGGEPSGADGRDASDAEERDGADTDGRDEAREDRREDGDKDGRDASGGEGLGSADVSDRGGSKVVPAGAGAGAGSHGEPGRSAPAGPRLTPAESAHSRALRRSVLLEVVVSVVVLMLTTILTGTLPGRAAAEAATTEQTGGLPVASVTTIPFDFGATGIRGKVQVTLDPGQVGDNSVQAVVYGPDGGFASIPELRLSFTLPSQDIGPLDAKVTDRGGYWASDRFNLPIAGTWKMKATIRVTDIDQMSVTRNVRIAG